MSVQTIMLDFSLDGARLGDQSGQKSVFEQLETVLKEYIPNLILAADIKLEGGSLKILSGKKGVTVSVRLLERGIITVNIEFHKEENEEPIITLKVLQSVHGSGGESCSCPSQVYRRSSILGILPWNSWVTHRDCRQPKELLKFFGEPALRGGSSEESLPTHTQNRRIDVELRRSACKFELK